MKAWWAMYVNGELVHVTGFDEGFKPKPVDFGMGVVPARDGEVIIEPCGIDYCRKCVSSKGDTVRVPFLSATLSLTCVERAAARRRT